MRVSTYYEVRSTEPVEQRADVLEEACGKVRREADTFRYVARGKLRLPDRLHWWHVRRLELARRRSG